MPSTPESNLRLELQATGENATTWGTKTNSNLELLSQAIAGAANVDVGGSGNYTLVASNYASDEARAATLVLTGTLTGNRDVIVPTTPKHYTVLNQTTGAFTLTIRQSAGTGVAIPSGSTLIVCTSTTCVDVGNIPKDSSVTQAKMAFNIYQQIQQQTVSAVSAVDFTLPAGFRRYRLEIDRGRVATSGQSLALRCGVGATFDAGASDYGAAFFTHTVGTAVSGSGSGSFIDVSGGLVAGDLRNSITIDIDSGSASDAFQARVAAGVIENTTPSYRVFNAFGSRVANGAKDAIRILASGGANVSGTFTLLGIPS